MMKKKTRKKRKKSETSALFTQGWTRGVGNFRGRGGGGRGRFNNNFGRGRGRGREQTNNNQNYYSENSNTQSSYRPFRGECFTCGKIGHKAANCRSGQRGVESGDAANYSKRVRTDTHVNNAELEDMNDHETAI